MSARTPAATAMAAMTLDHLSGGRFILGLGVIRSAGRRGLVRPAVPEAAGPHPRVRRHRPPDRAPRRSRSTSTASSTTCRYTGGDRARQAAEEHDPPAAHRDPDLPRRRGSEERRARRRDLRRLAAAVLQPEGERASTGSASTRGSPRPAIRRRRDRFEVASTCTIMPGDDVEKCADMVRPFLALYAGGMGARGANFHFEVFARMGYEDVALKVQDLYLAGQEARGGRGDPARDGRRRRPRRARRTRSAASSTSGGRRASPRSSSAAPTAGRCRCTPT